MYRNRLSPSIPRAGLWLMLAMLLAAAFALSSADPASALPPLPQCGNHVDDDGDRRVDYPADPGCSNRGDNSEADTGSTACSDGLDNDPVPDSRIDYPHDPGCVSAMDNDEADPASPPQCSDGLDNDPIPGDGRIDYLNDPGCIAASDNSETDRACSDGLDNEPAPDLLVDFPADPGCMAPVGDTASNQAPNQNDNNETDPPECNDGIDNDGDGWLDADAGPTKDPGCTGPRDTTEDPNPQCSDGKDNDRDGKIDVGKDPGCMSLEDADETDPPAPEPGPEPPPPASPACSDGLDNDKDKLTDFPDDAGCTSRSDDDETNPPPPTSGVSFDTSGPKAPVVAPVVTGPKGAPSTLRPLISPFPIVRLRGRADRTGVFITLLRVQAPKGSKVTVFCKGRSCPLRWKSVKTATGIVRSRPFERRLRVGTTLTIYVTKPGFMGKYTRFKIRRKKPPTRIDRCARSMGGPPVSCTSN